jgi:hypothetical protein
MPQPTAQKLKIYAGSTLLLINMPTHFRKNLEPLPDNVKISDKAKTYNQIHWFVKDQEQMEKELKKVLSLLKENVICWIYYPKGSSKIQTNLTRDKGWDALLKQDLQWVNLVSFDDTWSAFGMRQKTEKDKKPARAGTDGKDTKPKERPIFEYADSKTKTIRLPDDLATALKKNKKLEDYFNSLAFSHRREYVEWIVTAKKEETRKERIKGALERLEKKWKNPRNL